MVENIQILGLDKFNESRNFANKSAILEGIAIAA